MCYSPTKKIVLALIHTTRCLRKIFRAYKVNVVTDGPMEGILKDKESKYLQAHDKNNEGTSGPKGKLQKESSPTLRAWWLYIRREPNKKGSRAGMVLVDLKFLVDQAEGNKVPRIEVEKRYKEEIMYDMVHFHRFWIMHLPKALNPKAKALKGLASIRVEFLNREVSVGVKTRPSMEA
ncbi:hypothetical protein Tco_1576389 [Tanacetum coccineum]